MTKKQGLEKIVNDCIQKFIDLIDNQNLPEKDEIQNKIQLYEKVPILPSKFLGGLLQPKGHPDNLKSVFQQHEVKDILHKMAQLDSKLQEETSKLQRLFDPDSITHRIKN